MGEVPRRDVLRVAAAAGAVGAASALSAFPAFAGPARRPVPDRAWAHLATMVKGRLLRPGDRDFVRAATPQNKQLADDLPAGVLLATTSQDVSTAIIWARDAGVTVTPRSGRHGQERYAFGSGDSIVIDTSRMARITPTSSGDAVSVEAGARVADIVTPRAGGFTIPAGFCPTVGVSGIALGGGFGHSHRSLGLTSDSLLRTEVVLADGQLVTCDADRHPDLFYACRGGGGGNFGINTRFVFRTHPVGDMTTYRIQWPWHEGPRALQEVQQLMASAPRALSCGLALTATGQGNGRTRSVSATGQFSGGEQDLRDLLAPGLRIRGVRAHIARRTFADAARHLSENTPDDRYAIRSNFTDTLTPDAFTSLLAAIGRWPGSSNSGGGRVALMAWGGAIADVPTTATAFVHRSARWLMTYETSWTARDTPFTVRAGREWLAELHATMQDRGKGVLPQAYQNFLDPALKDWAHAYYGEALPKLRRIKRTYDPDRFFDFPHAIPA